MKSATYPTKMPMDDMTNITESSSYDLHPPRPRGTPWNRIFKCGWCIPKRQDEERNRLLGLDPTANDDTDFDESETGMVYFDLPDVETGPEGNTSDGATKVVMGPPIVDQFLKLIFSIFMLNWLQKTDKKRITES